MQWSLISLILTPLYFFQLPGNYSMRAFPTVHRIPSQGYILYKTVKKLKAEYVGQPSATIAELNRNNIDIHDIIATPEVAYTGICHDS